MTSNIEISRTTFITICIAMFVLTIALSLSLYKLTKFQSREDEPLDEVEPPANGAVIQDGKQVPFGKEAREFFAKEGYAVAELVNEIGQIKIVRTTDGKDVGACGVGLKAPEACGLGETKIRTGVSSFTIHHRSSHCITQKIGNTWLTFHTRGPNKGRWGCHAGGPHH